MSAPQALDKEISAVLDLLPRSGPIRFAACQLLLDYRRDALGAVKEFGRGIASSLVRAYRRQLLAQLVRLSAAAGKGVQDA